MTMWCDENGERALNKECFSVHTREQKKKKKTAKLMRKRNKCMILDLAVEENQWKIQDACRILHLAIVVPSYIFNSHKIL